VINQIGSEGQNRGVQDSSLQQLSGDEVRLIIIKNGEVGFSSSEFLKF